MTKKLLLVLCLSHGVVAMLGFGAGIYTLPILIEPPAPSLTEIETIAEQANYRTQFVRDLPGSDAFHWGEGDLYVGEQKISFKGELSPGPDYKLYLSPEFVDSESGFNAIKSEMQQVGDVKTFSNFIVELPSDIELAHFNTVVVWCETFGEFITAAQFR